MSDSVTKTPVIVSDSSLKLPEKISLNSKTFDEAWMQNLLEKTPSILPTADVEGIFAPLISLGREVPVEVAPGRMGYIDNLYLSKKGYLVIVETKLWRNPEARRQVVAQIIDYAKEAQKWDFDDLSSIYKSFYKSDLKDKLIQEKFIENEEDEKAFIDTVQKNIESARFLLLIVGDGIQSGLDKLAEFINGNSTMQFRLALCELDVYKVNETERLVIPHLTAKTQIIERGIIRIDSVTKEFLGIKTPDEDVESETIETATDRSKYGRENWLTLPEWINSKLKKSVDTDEFRSLVDTFEDNGIGYHIGTGDIHFYCNVGVNQTKMILLRVFGDGLSSVILQPKTFYSFLDKYNYSRSYGEKVMNFFKPLLKKEQKCNPYEKEECYYRIDIETLLKNKDEILETFKEFMSSF